MELRLVAHLKDTLPFQDKLQLSVQDGQMHAVPLSASGTGTTIVSDRPFGPTLDLGTHFRSERRPNSFQSQMPKTYNIYIAASKI